MHEKCSKACIFFDHDTGFVVASIAIVPSQSVHRLILTTSIDLQGFCSDDQLPVGHNNGLGEIRVERFIWPVNCLLIKVQTSYLHT